MMDRLTEQAQLIDSLVRQLEAGGHEVTQFETHVSRVLLVGAYAYKFKKALRLPFLDDATLEARRLHCEQECQLNRRLAPGMYIGVVAVTGAIDQPVLGGAGAALEYAVKMHAFEQRALWGCRIADGVIDGGDIDRLAQILARFHNAAARAPDASAWGSAETISAAFAGTLDELSTLAGEGDCADRLSALREWEASERVRLKSRFWLRKAQGMVRECHGDLHCDNVLTADGRVRVFDRIEFSDSLRWIDVMDDLAFICMDLAWRGRADFAARLLNRYLESTGDYAGLAVLPYYRVHRALVRAKVMLLRSRQRGIAKGARERYRKEGHAYLAFASQCMRPGHAALVVTHGYSGSGKTTLCRLLVEILGAVQIRSDIERKRLHVGPGYPGAATPCWPMLYGAAATRRTYRRLHSLAKEITGAGWPVLVDATCLMAAQRASFRALAREMMVPCFLFDVRADQATAAGRIVSRKDEGLDASDADVAVLERQIAEGEPLTPAEAASAIVIDSAAGISTERARRACAPVLATLLAES